MGGEPEARSWRAYLREAFWLRAPLPGLGRVPLNAVAALGLGILGLGHPAFWLLGIGLEAGYLGMLAGHPRFQRWIDAQRRSAGIASPATELRLAPEARERLERLERKCARIAELQSAARAEDFGENRDALDRLLGLYGQLLASRSELESSRARIDSADLERRIASLEREIERPDASAALRDSQAATLKLLRQRRSTLGRCQELLLEVDSDLERIENQVDLTLENAGLPGRDDLAKANLELASELLERGLDFGVAVTVEPEASGAEERRRPEREGRKA